MGSQKQICAFGPAVLDDVVKPKPRSFAQTSKVLCTIMTVLGGGGPNALRQARALGAAVRLVALVGDDEIGTKVSQLAVAEFSDALCLPLLEQTRRSIINGQRSGRLGNRCESGNSRSRCCSGSGKPT